MTNSTQYMLAQMEKPSSSKSKVNSEPEVQTSDTKTSVEESSLQKLVQECLIKKDQYSNTPYS
ncbi:hypothetical protein [Legionella clemsonensis]|uniref:Uncharacterized protein n=1 Tax=Legionella clemsonensis TaxID=1867846 RepID=A0A222P070_9GAMM|nr:hypothetical protein [Legionella clemsonensis]ASQ45254.1 hypothetical protein clem_03480 [Legionella clemsonensis]